MKRIRITKSLAGRMITLSIVIAMVPLLFYGLISILSTGNVLRGEAVRSQQEIVRQGALYIDLVMNDVESLISNLSGIEELNNAISQDAEESSYDRLLTQAKIGYILSGYTNLNGLVSIDLFSAAGAHYHVGETLNITSVNRELIDRLFLEASASTAFVNWNGIETSLLTESAYPNVIIATKALVKKDTDGTQSNGLLIVSYDPAVFRAAFGSQANDAGYSIIVDQKHRIVYHPDASYIGKTLSADMSDHINARTQDMFQHVLDGQSVLTVFDSTQKGNWTVLKFVPVNYLQSKVSAMNVWFIALLSFSVVSIAIYGVLISRQIVAPIRTITKTFRSLQSGDFQDAVKLSVKTGDEIGELGNLFNSFIEAREDITTQKKMERQLNQQNQELLETVLKLQTTQTQLIQQEKLAGIGQLAAGVAHEINNPLGYVIANFGMMGKNVHRLESMLDHIDALRKADTAGMDADCVKLFAMLNGYWQEYRIDEYRKDMREMSADVVEGLARIEKIVNSLKSFTRASQMEERGLYDMNKGVESTLVIANNEIKYNADMEVDAGPVPPISANGGQINQVLLNVLINAVHAIKCRHGGKKGSIRIHTGTEGGYACCEIYDDGCGMSDEVKNRIFEPFFTTKPVGQGTGLGLGIAYDIVVNKHGGKIEVTSAIGQGSCFRILLPLNRSGEMEEE